MIVTRKNSEKVIKEKTPTEIIKIENYDYRATPYREFKHNVPYDKCEKMCVEDSKCNFFTHGINRQRY